MACPWFIVAAVACGAAPVPRFVAGAVLAQDSDAAAEAQNQLVGLIGLLVLAGVTATEAGLALKRARQTNA